MMCPYRVQVNKTITLTGSVNTVRENVEYAECYGPNCPFFVDSDAFAEPFCGRAYNELGGEL